MKQIYSPRQIYTATFLTGPLVAIFLLHGNFLNLEKHDLAKFTLYLGSFFLILFFGVIPFIPDQVPQVTLPVICAVAAWQISEKSQMDKVDIETSEEHDFQSNWKVFWCSVAGLLMSMVVIIGILYLYNSLGYIELA